MAIKKKRDIVAARQTDQNNYIEKCVSELATKLTNQIQRHNPELMVRVERRIADGKRQLSIQVTHDRQDSYGVRKILSLRGPLQLSWRGKHLKFEFMHNHGTHSYDLKYRRAPLARAIFDVIQKSLPEKAPDLTKVVKKAPLIASHEPTAIAAAVKTKKPTTAKARRADRAVSEYSLEQILFMNGRIMNLETNFNNRMDASGKKIFENAKVELNTEIEAEGSVAYVDIRLRPRPQYHKPGTPNEIWVRGKLSLIWRGDKGESSRMDLTDIKGIGQNDGLKLADIPLSRKNNDVAREVFNLLVASQRLAKPGNKQLRGLRREMEESQNHAHIEPDLPMFEKHHHHRVRRGQNLQHVAQSRALPETIDMPAQVQGAQLVVVYKEARSGDQGTVMSKAMEIAQTRKSQAIKLQTLKPQTQ